VTWLTNLLTNIGTNYIGKFLSSAFTFLKDFFAMKQKEKSINADAKSVEDISAEIKKLILEGKPVPEELKNALRSASRKLISNSNLN
jgi:hypothetical protein